MPRGFHKDKRDANEPEIVQGLKALGASVCVISAKGVPDLLVGWRGHNLLFEAKSAAGKLTEHQIKWHAEWQGTVHIVRTLDDAITVLNEIAPTLFLVQYTMHTDKYTPLNKLFYRYADAYAFFRGLGEHVQWKVLSKIEGTECTLITW